MTFLREFEDDIFISYAHIDNQPLADGQKGWITSFHKALEVRLSQLLGERPEFWRDEAKLRGNDFFNDAIILRLPKIAILVSVITPRYVKSGWCLKEIQEFYKVAEQTGGVRIDDKSRIFKVVKTPVPPDRHPPELQDLQTMLGYDFFQIDPTTGKLREFIFNSGPNTDNGYWAKLDDLAQDIYQLLEVLGGRKQGLPEETPAQSGITVYLAETTLDLIGERDKIRRELQQRGYKILPDNPLPLNATDFQTVVREHLRRSNLSIHLIGANYGVIPEAADCSVVCLQNELAAERSQDQSFSRIIWMPPGLQAREERQQKFIDYLHYDSNAQHGAEVLQTTIEDLKTIIQDKVNVVSLPAPSALSDDGPRRIYLICDQQDMTDIGVVSDYLFDQGFEVVTPMLEGDEAQVRADHKEQLVHCDGILIYYGRGGDPWLRTKLLDLRKLPAYGRTKPLLAKAVYVGSPESPAKERFRTLEAPIIMSPKMFSTEPLKPFLTQLEQAKGARR